MIPAQMGSFPRKRYKRNTCTSASADDISDSDRNTFRCIMKFLIVAIVLAVLANAEAAPKFKPKMAPQPRITCDLLSFNLPIGSFGDSLCTAHCYALGYRGGYCDDRNICNCRI
ncbi:U-Asilidin(12)-Dg3b-like [Branchiostoma floridae x Branchiostoma japonicum]